MKAMTVTLPMCSVNFMDTTLSVEEQAVADRIQELKEQGLSLQLMMPNERQFSEIYLMEEAVWASNFNQMYLLGNYNKEVFEEVFHAFPIARLFRLKDLEPLE